MPLPLFPGPSRSAGALTVGPTAGSGGADGQVLEPAGLGCGLCVLLTVCLWARSSTSLSFQVHPLDNRELAPAPKGSRE